MVLDVKSHEADTNSHLLILLPRFQRRKVLWLTVVCLSLFTCFYLFVAPSKVIKKEVPHPVLTKFNWLSLDNRSTLNGCRNSIQGPTLIADELGYVCQLIWVNPTGCCNVDHAIRFDCSSCQQTSCCAVYEHCVSCCLNVDKKPILEMVLAHSSRSLHPLYSSVKDQFELCLAKCRTSSQSVHHENSYRNPESKYCYGLEGTTSMK